MDWAEASLILGIPESASDAEIKEQYLYKAQLLHPDKNQDKPESVRKKAEAELALVNQAYVFLTNPNNNPYKIPPKLAVEPRRIRFTEMGPGEKKATTFTIRNVGGPYTSVWIDNQPAPWLAVTGVKSLSTERLPLEVTLEGTGTGEPGKSYTSDLAIRLENEHSHLVDKVTVEIELHTRVEAVKSAAVKGAPAAAPNPGAAVPLTKTTPTAGPKNPPVAQKKKSGFSLGAFLANFIAFAVLGVPAVYFVLKLTTVDDLYIMVGAGLYAVIAFGFSLNHGLNVGSRAGPAGPANKRP